MYLGRGLMCGLTREGGETASPMVDGHSVHEVLAIFSSKSDCEFFWINGRPLKAEKSRPHQGLRTPKPRATLTVSPHCPASDHLP